MNALACTVAVASSFILPATRDVRVAAPQPDDPKDVQAIAKTFGVGGVWSEADGTVVWINAGAAKRDGAAEQGRIRALLPRFARLHGVRRLDCDRADDICLETIAAWTALEELNVGCNDPDLPGITDAGLKYLKGMRSLRRLRLTGQITDAGLRELAGLHRLTRLSVWGSSISDSGIETLAGLRNLTQLEVDDEKITDAGLRRLAALHDLKVLAVGKAPITGKGLAYLKDLKQLRSLNLSGTKLAPEDIFPLAALPRLRELDLPQTPTTEEEEWLAPFARVEDLKVTFRGRKPRRKVEWDDPQDVAALRAAGVGVDTGDRGNVTGASLSTVGPERPGAWLAVLKRLHSLEKLELPRGTMDEDLVHLHGVSTLQVLKVGGVRVTDDGLANLARLTRLRELDLVAAQGVTGIGLVHLSRLTKLERLRLPGETVDHAGLRCLPDLPLLRDLDLDGASITDAALERVGKLAALEKLNLSFTNTTDAGLVHLRGLKQLESIDIHETTITMDGLRELQRFLPKLMLPRYYWEPTGVR